MGQIFFRSFSVISTFLALDSPHLEASRWMCVSTGKAGIPYHCDITTLAVLCPTPAKLSRYFQSERTPPPAISCWAIFLRFFALVGANPIFLIKFLIVSTSGVAINSGVFAFLNKAGVTLFTILSVVCADNITATSNVYALSCSSGMGGLG